MFMFEEGNILYFDPFVFKNPASASKPKYFVVLKNLGDEIILASLPSSQKHIPVVLHSTYGCIHEPENGIGCFAFKGGEIVSENNFKFPLDTYLYGEQLDEYSIKTIQEQYPFPGIQYELKGKFKSEILDQIKACFRTAASVKKRFKRLL